MPKLIYYRLAGNALALASHSINSIVMLSALQDEILIKDPDIEKLASMQSRFLTIWNVAFQMTYAGLALVCDGLTVLNKDHLLPKNIKKFRDIFFSSVVFPGTLLVFSVFWPIFIYDRSLIFPEFIDKAFSFKSNCVMHLAILPFVLWELAFQPRNIPKSHKRNVLILIAYYFVYSVHIHITYYERGLWPYPLVYMIYNTIYYYYFQTLIISITIGSYFVQWPLYTLLWGDEKKIK